MESFDPARVYRVAYELIRADALDAPTVTMHVEHAAEPVPD